MSDLTTEEFDVFGFEEMFERKASYSMYEVAHIWTKLRGKVVREQMMYTYRKNRLIQVGPDGRCSHDQLVLFLVKKGFK
jgi:hypothetical protein